MMWSPGSYCKNKIANPVDVTRDSEKAIEYLQCKEKYLLRSTVNPVVIFIDIKIPKVNGLEVLKLIRNYEKLRLTPVVILHLLMKSKI